MGHTVTTLFLHSVVDSKPFSLFLLNHFYHPTHSLMETHTDSQTDAHMYSRGFDICPIVQRRKQAHENTTHMRGCQHIWKHMQRGTRAGNCTYGIYTCKHIHTQTHTRTCARVHTCK
eukprot:TRINITY_DN16981_c0_g1_i4.p1 TRINITY_DN16981_c0_g1~~TRINITY_DN16981_c0_g1_i4.p1  ORF type:complete len:117 (+),score=4.52 TRINITY_DN16981_c0_g1_i4:94-444(+)